MSNKEDSKELFKMVREFAKTVRGSSPRRLEGAI
jgi:hypothetical protein